MIYDMYVINIYKYKCIYINIYIYNTCNHENNNDGLM